MADIQVLKDELTNDPLGRVYSVMSDEAAAAHLNDTTTGRTLPADTLSAATIYEAIVTAEFDALNVGNKNAVDRILGLGDGVILTPGSQARSVLTSAFPGGTTTRDNIVAQVNRAVSRSEELGLGRVKAGHVQMARA